MTQRSKEVKELFENTGLYLTYDYNLTIRKETVEAFTRGMNFSSVLDIPSGTGAISIPLLPRTEKLTLVDISSNMLALAEKNIPAAYKNKAELINADFFETQLPGRSFDLVICLGLLAHVDSPGRLLERISRVVKPGGYLVVQNTDASHFYSYLIRLYLWLKGLVVKQPYKLNPVKTSFVVSELEKHGLKKIAGYRYNQSFLGLSNLFSNEKKYGLTRWFFGNADHNRNAGWGSDHTMLFKSE